MKLEHNDVLKSSSVQHNVKLKGKSGCEHQLMRIGNMKRTALLIE